MSMLRNSFLGGAGGAAIGPLTFDPAKYAFGQLALSNGNRTMTRNNASAGAYSFSFGTNARSSGKHYFEIVLDDNHYINDPAVFGPALTTAPLNVSSGSGGSNTEASGLGESAVILHTGQGNWYLNATLQAAVVVACVTGDVVGMAVDNALQKVWFRRNTEGWNSELGGTQDPATGDGGIALPTSAGWGAGSPLWPRVGIRRNNGFPGGVTTLNGDTLQFVHAPPAGFLAWGV